MRLQRMFGILTFLLVAVVVTIPTGAQDPIGARESSESSVESRSLARLTKDVRTAMRAEATLTETTSWETAVRALVALNDELRIHPKNRKGSSFAKLKRSVRRRLLNVQKQLARTDRNRKDELAQSDKAKPLQIEETATALAQQAGGFRPVAGAGRGRFAGPGAAGLGGPAALGDYGEDLVNLIESTISADVWQSVGGPAAIIYYQPSLALIITAPVDVHENVNNLLRQLRAAGGP
jgi:hypothetical protein